MMKGLVVDENMSNLTSTSSEISASSGTRNDTGSLYPRYSSTSTNQEPQPKKKRNLPGHPDPDAEVIALTPKTLLATNRFICEICNKGFQRDQNLQLHRRGHNLPWKLKQRNSNETRKKVYVCPEATCVHHDPSRALGDLTGIKKHFCRKHWEKKWKCEKCLKRYAVQSDWKAHSKICGTREYKCDCGTIFSRRDSFITHRAFCDALAQESARALNITATNPPLSSHHNPLHNYELHAPPSVKREQEYFNLRPEIPPWLAPPAVGGEAVTDLDFSSQQPPLLPTQLDHSITLHENPNNNLIITLLPSLQSTSSPHMSATALLQKASQIGATMSKTTAPSLSMLRPHLQYHQGHVPDDECTKGYGSSSSTMASLSSSVSGMAMHSREEIGSGFGHGLAPYGNKAASTNTDYLEEGAAKTEADDDDHHHHHLESSLFHDVMMGSTVHSASGFEEAMAMRGMFNAARDNNNNNNNNNDNNNNNSKLFQELVSKSTQSLFSRTNKGATTGEGANDDEMTRDFLGLRAFSQRDLFNMSGLDHLGSSSYGKQNHNHPPWQG